MLKKLLQNEEAMKIIEKQTARSNRNNQHNQHEISLQAQQELLNKIAMLEAENNQLKEVQATQEDQVIDTQKNSNDDYLNKLLIESARKGETAKVIAALELGANRNVTDEQGNTAFVLSLKNNHEELIQLLLPTFCEETLKAICENSNDEFIKQSVLNSPKDESGIAILLTVYNQIANQFAQNCIANSLLLTAAKQGNINLAEKSLRYGADINTTDHFNETPLHKASYAKEKQMLEFLLANGADPSVKDRNQQSPDQLTSDKSIKELILNYAKREQSAKAIQRTFRNYFYNKIEDQASKVLIDFIKKGESEKIQELGEALKQKDIKKLNFMIKEHQSDKPQTIAQKKNVLK